MQRAQIVLLGSNVIKQQHKWYKNFEDAFIITYQKGTPISAIREIFVGSTCHNFIGRFTPISTRVPLILSNFIENYLATLICNCY